MTLGSQQLPQEATESLGLEIERRLRASFVESSWSVQNEQQLLKNFPLIRNLTVGMVIGESEEEHAIIGLEDTYDNEYEERGESFLQKTDKPQ